MISDGAPAVVFRPLHDARLNSVQIDIGKAVDHGAPFLYDHAHKHRGPECSPALLFPVVDSGKCLFDVLYIARETGKPFSEILLLTFVEFSPVE